MRLITLKLLLIALVFLSIFNFGVVFAQDQSSPSAAVQEVDSSRIAGQIIKVESETITINTRDGVKQVNVSGNINITKNGTNVSVSKLEPGDGVVVTRTATGDVLSVDALSGTALDISKWVLPIGLGVLVLAILAFLAWIRMRKDYIKTAGPRS